MLRNEEIDSKTDYGHGAKDEVGVGGGFMNNTGKSPVCWILVNL